MVLYDCHGICNDNVPSLLLHGYICPIFSTYTFILLCKTLGIALLQAGYGRESHDPGPGLFQVQFMPKEDGPHCDVMPQELRPFRSRVSYLLVIILIVEGSNPIDSESDRICNLNQCLVDMPFLTRD